MGLIAVFAFIFILAVVVTRLSRAIDHIVFPKFRKQKLEKPMYIVANPRSGTTHLHHLLSLDEARFAPLKLYQTILASVWAYRVVGFLSRIDRALGRPIGRLLEFIESRVFSGWDKVHPTGLTRNEEPEATWVMTMMTPSAYMLFPHFDENKDIDFIDRMQDKAALNAGLDYYVESMRRHMFAVGQGKTLLNKSVYFASRMDPVLRRMPDIQFVYLVRHPYESVASALSMFQAPWRAHSPELFQDPVASRKFADLFLSYYKYYLMKQKELPASQFFQLYYDDLVRDPVGTVESIYDHFELEMTPTYRRALVNAASRARRHQSEHDYTLEDFGISEEYIYNAIPEVFEAYGFARETSDAPRGPVTDADAIELPERLKQPAPTATGNPTGVPSLTTHRVASS